MLAVGVCLLLSIDIEVKVVDSLRASQLDCNVDARHRVESLRLRLTTAATHNPQKTFYLFKNVKVHFRPLYGVLVTR